MKKLFAVLLAVSLLLCASFTGCGEYEYTLHADEIKNVILFIGDGMGPNQVKLGRTVKGAPLCFENFACQTTSNTLCLSIRGGGSLEITDSAAAATAMATGNLTVKRHVGMLQYGETELKTIMDHALELGKSTGVITTEQLTGATPMGFSAHSYDRGSFDELCESAANSGINFFAGDTFSGDNENKNEYYTNAGYVEINALDEYESVKTQPKILCNLPIAPKKVVGDGGEVIKESFDEVVLTALNYLSQDEDGFCLMAEGAHIDHGGHNNDIEYMLRELLAFDVAVEAALKWAKGRTDTVVIVTADHETGFLMLYDGLTAENYLETDETTGKPKYYKWGSGDHSDTNVGLYINGKTVDFSKYTFDYGTASLFGNEDAGIKNCHVFTIMKDLMDNAI